MNNNKHVKECMIPYVFEAVRGKPYMNFLRTIKVNLYVKGISREKYRESRSLSFPINLSHVCEECLLRMRSLF